MRLNDIGDGWVKDLDQLKRLVPLADDAGFRADFAAAKRANKERLAALVQRRLGLDVDADSLFDVHVKRMHEYKRQLLNLLHVVTRYNRLRATPSGDAVARTVIFGGKAAPGYAVAKLIIKLINDIGSGYFSPDEPERFRPVVDALLQHGDQYLVLADYASYIACQRDVDAMYRDQDRWVRTAILNVASMGRFSSDRTVLQYAAEIWHTRPVLPPGGIGQPDAAP